MESPQVKFKDAVIVFIKKNIILLLAVHNIICISMMKKCNEIPTFYFDALKILDIYSEMLLMRNQIRRIIIASLSL